MQPTPAIAWDLPNPHLLPVTVHSSHIDFMQHTNNVVYLQWLEDVAWHHSLALGLGPGEYTRLGHGMVVRTHELHYLQPSWLHDDIVLATWLTEVDKVSLHRRYQFVRASDGQTVFRGGTHFVCVEMASGKLRRMPAAFFEVYSAAVISMPGGSKP